MRKKFVSIILGVACMASLLTGCQMKDSSQPGQEVSGTQKQETAGQESSVSETEGNVQDAVTLDLYLDFTWYPVDSWTGIIPETLTENGGVYFDVTRSADDSQLGLMIASGELPDVIYTDKEIDRLCDSNLCYSYNELIEKYGVDLQPTEDRIAIAKSHNADKEDPNYYTILNCYSTNEEWNNAKGVVRNTPCLYYRKDIWEELGKPEMNTLEDIANVCMMVKEKYPEMITVNAGNPSWRLGAFKSWMGNGNDFVYAEDGSVILSDMTENYYEYLSYVNQMYRNGLISEENLAITNEDDAKQQAISGKCFIYEWNLRPTQLEQLNTATKEVIEGAEWAAIPIPDDAKEIVGAGSGWAGVFISKNCKDPEAAIKMISYMSSEEGRHLALWGREGVEYELDENGVPLFSEEWQKAAKNQDEINSKYNNTYNMCVTELDEAYSFYSGVNPELLEGFVKNTNKIVNYPELSIALPPSTSDMGVVLAKIKEAREAELVKIYTAESDKAFEKAYQDYMDLLEQIGSQELNSYMTERTNEVKTEFGF